jgi:hypothetical protein
VTRPYKLKGELHWRSKLTEKQAREILNTHPKPRHFFKLKAMEFGVSKHTIYTVHYRKSWRHLDQS